MEQDQESEKITTNDKSQFFIGTGYIFLIESERLHCIHCSPVNIATQIVVLRIIFVWKIKDCYIHLDMIKYS